MQVRGGGWDWVTQVHKVHDRGGRGVKKVKICVTSFMNGPYVRYVICEVKVREHFSE